MAQNGGTTINNKEIPELLAARSGVMKNCRGLPEEYRSRWSEAMTIAEFIYTVLLKPKSVKSAVNSVIRMFLPQTVRYGPISVVLNPKDPVVSGALMLHVYERSEMTFVERSLRHGMTVVDVGANVGLYSALSGHLV